MRALFFIPVFVLGNFNQAIFAQDYSEPATFGNIELESGFVPDPHRVELSAGGSMDASDLDGSCVGNIANAPDLQLDYDSGSYPLIFSVGSENDTSLVINLPDGNWLCDDDSGEGLNPLLELSDPSSGVYDIWVGSVGSDDFPAAILYISEESANYTYESSSSLEDNMDGDFVSGRLEVLEDVYTFDGSRGQEVIIDLRSESFDTYLSIESPSGERFTNDDYEGDTTRSLVSLRLEESGEYTVHVSSFFSDENGDYRLAIDTELSSAAELDRQIVGTLSTSDRTRNEGQFLDTYEFTGSPGRSVVLDLESFDFDTYLMLESPTGEILENDDTDHIGHSVIETQLSEFGTYYAYVSSYDSSEIGDYELNISGSGAASSTNRDTTNLTLDETSSGNLASGDAIGDRNEYMDYYSFTGNAGQNIRFQVESQNFDTYLTIIGPDGIEITNDDFNGDTAISVVEMELPVSGRYSVIVSSYREDEVGSYQLATSFASASSPLFVTENSASSSTSQIYGIFVGISDYSELRQTQPGWGDLPYTADDAVVARDSLLEFAGMSSANAITLLDQDATVENVRQAFNTLASQIDSNDTFVFFYSGHGGQELRTGGPVANDADGFDETLALSNNTITDDEINDLFNLIDANTSLIILDSCFSGGFAKDVVSRPGRMGLFSSDEDVPSLVAGKFQAGGFLSYFFHDAIEAGNADLDGDSAINAMELSQYIHERYNVESLSKGPSSFNTPDFGYQHLVADRGGVSHDEILFTVR